MANNLIQVRRTSVAGREANTQTLPNAGELALNILDGRMFSTNGDVVFEIGANTKNSRVSETLYVGNDSINVTINSTAINSGSIQLATAAYVGANVDLTTTGLFVGNSSVNSTVTSSELAIEISATANLTANSTLVQVANSTGTSNLVPGALYISNSTINTGITIPSAEQYSGEYYLHANGTWAEVPGADPAGSNTPGRGDPAVDTRTTGPTRRDPRPQPRTGRGPSSQETLR